MFQAELRKEVFLAVNSVEGSNGGNDDGEVLPSVKNDESARNTLDLVYEFLQYYRLQHTLQVLQCELNDNEYMAVSYYHAHS